MKNLELLAPAKNFAYGKEAVSHGADAVYIGAPRFGARRNAGASISEIEELIRYAHLYKAKVYVALNTLLFEDELRAAEEIIQQLYEIGADALIIQDMGLLECRLPPIALHASTQCHIADVEKLRFMEAMGFERAVLARELSLAEMKSFSDQTEIELEAFVHGALCVCYSGQCYMSQALVGKSGNRGECTQPCRSHYDLYNAEGKCLQRSKHLLSTKDFNASAYLKEMAEAGIGSFKIEGRLKDLSYVKNITAYYRQALDFVLLDMPEKKKSSSGKTEFFFTPDPDKSFNRTYTSYFLNGRSEAVGMRDTQKSLGKKIGRVIHKKEDYISVHSQERIIAGDGLCFFDPEGILNGFSVHRVEGNRIFTPPAINVAQDAELYRNQDLAFEKSLSIPSASRKIEVAMQFSQMQDGLFLNLCDEDGICVELEKKISLELAAKSEGLKENIEKQLRKTGDSPFFVKELELPEPILYFVPMSVLNSLRRECLEMLAKERERAFRPQEKKRKIDMQKKGGFPGTYLDYRTNIANTNAQKVYESVGMLEQEPAFELKGGNEKILMKTRLCIRYEAGQCPRYQKISKEYAQELYLRNQREIFTLHFDCENCVMEVKRK